MDRPEFEMSGLEARLAQWKPAAAGIDRDRLLFLAGRASARYDARRAMVGLAACFVLVTVTSVASLFGYERSRVRALEAALAEATAPRSVPRELRKSRNVPPPASGSYLVLTRRALSRGLGDEFAASETSSPPGIPIRSLRVRGTLPEL